MSSFETDNGKGWLIEVIGANEAERAQTWRAALKPLGRSSRRDRPRAGQELAAGKPASGLPEFRAGPFFFYGSHFKGKVPKDMIGLEIDAGMAFGTGRHETTKGCLLALARLAKTRKFKKPLDVGTGTGILAFARRAAVQCHRAGRRQRRRLGAGGAGECGGQQARRSRCASCTVRRLSRQGDPRRRAVRSRHRQHPRQSADPAGARPGARAGQGWPRGAVRPVARAGEGRAGGA